MAASNWSGQRLAHTLQELWPWAALSCMLAVGLPSPLQAPCDRLAEAVVHNGGRCAAAAGANSVEGTDATLSRTLEQCATQDAWQDGRCSLKVEGLRHGFASRPATFGLGLATRCRAGACSARSCRARGIRGCLALTMPSPPRCCGCPLLLHLLEVLLGCELLQYVRTKPNAEVKNTPCG
jgi:hypothetical protein